MLGLGLPFTKKVCPWPCSVVKGEPGAHLGARVRRGATKAPQRL